MMDLGIQLNLGSQPKSAGLGGTADFSSDETSTFADVLKQELAAETASATAFSEDVLAGYRAAGSANDTEQLKLSTLAASVGQALNEQIAQQQPDSGQLATGQEIAASPMIELLLDASNGKAELPVEPGRGIVTEALQDAVSSAATAGQTIATSLVGESNRIIASSDDEGLPGSAAFANSTALSNGDKQGISSTPAHLLDLIGRSRGFTPAALDQTHAELASGGNIHGTDSNASAGNLLVAGSVAGNVAQIAGQTTELAAQAEFATEPADTAVIDALANRVSASNAAPGSSTTSMQANPASQIKQTDLHQAGMTGAAVADASAAAMIVTAGTELAGVLANAANSKEAVNAELAGTGGVAASPGQLRQIQAAAPAATQSAAALVPAELIPANDSVAVMAAATVIDGAANDQNGKKTSFAEHLRQVNQQLKAQADSPAQQKASADQQQKGQEQPQQQAAVPQMPAGQTPLVNAAGVASTFASLLPAEPQLNQTAGTVQQAASVTPAVYQSAIQAGRPLTDFSAPVQLYEQQAALQLKDKVIYQLTNKIQSAEIRLNPEELGSVQIKLSLQQDQLNLQFTVSQPQAKEALEQQLPKLRELLEQQGLQLAQSNIEQRSGQQQEQSRQFSGGRAGNTEQEVEPVLAEQPLRLADRLVDYYA